MIHINAIQRLPDSASEIEKPLHLEISFDSRTAEEMSDALLLLAASIHSIINSIKEPSKDENT